MLAVMFVLLSQSPVHSQDSCHQNMMLFWKINFLSLDVHTVKYRLKFQPEILFVALDGQRT